MSLKEKLKKRAEREAEKTSEDVQWALEQDPDTANKVMKFMRSSIAVKLAVILGVLGSIYFVVTTFSTFQLLVLGYFLTGIGVVKVSDYGFRDWESYFAVVAWLPVVLYSFLPDKVRIEK